MNYDILYFYIKAAIFNEEHIAIDVVDTLKFNKTDFSSHILDNLLLENQDSEDTKILNLFCIGGKKEKIKEISNTVSNTVKQTFQDVVNSDFEIKEYDQIHEENILDQMVSIYTTYLLNNSLCPNVFSFSINDIDFVCFYGTKDYISKTPEEIINTLHFWSKKEKPIFLGKQMVTHPFFFKNLIGRKSIQLLPSQEDDKLYLVLEGNIKIPLDYDSVGTVNRFDTDTFHSTDIQEILYNSVYSFEYTFEPYLLFLDWFDIYLYTIGLLDVNLNDLDRLQKSYESFLDFIDKNICDKVMENGNIIWFFAKSCG